MRYTRSIVRIYIGNTLVTTHRRSSDRYNLYVTDNSHLASKSAWIRDQNVESYRRRAASVCPALEKDIDAVFDDGISRGFAVECRYNTCNGILANARKHAPHIVEQASLAAMEKGTYSSRVFGMMLKSMNRLDIANRQNNPEPSDGENLRGKMKLA